MLRMLRAHGLDAGPTQRPLLAGATAGLIADIPAIALLGLFGSLGALGPAAGTSSVVAGLAYGGMMLLGGVLYGWLFQRAGALARGASGHDVRSAGRDVHLRECAADEQHHGG